MTDADFPGGTTGLILACAALTCATRVGGHLILARLPRVPYRLEAALNAVPVAVLGALIAPAIVLGGPAEIAAAFAAGLAGLRLSATWVVALGLVALVAARRLGG